MEVVGIPLSPKRVKLIRSAVSHDTGIPDVIARRVYTECNEFLSVYEIHGFGIDFELSVREWEAVANSEEISDELSATITEYTKELSEANQK